MWLYNSTVDKIMDVVLIAIKHQSSTNPDAPTDLFPQHILTLSDCIVTYFHPLQFPTGDTEEEDRAREQKEFAAIDKQLTQILAANPNSDLTKYEKALAIRILNVDRKTTPPPTPPPLSHDNVIGEKE